MHRVRFSLLQNPLPARTHAGSRKEEGGVVFLRMKVIRNEVSQQKIPGPQSL